LVWAHGNRRKKNKRVLLRSKKREYQTFARGVEETIKDPWKKKASNCIPEEKNLNNRDCGKAKGCIKRTSKVSWKGMGY